MDMDFYNVYIANILGEALHKGTNFSQNRLTLQKVWHSHHDKVTRRQP